MYDALHKGAWDKGCNDIMYMTIAYQSAPSNYTTKGKLCVNVLRLRNSCFHFGTLSSVRYHWIMTPSMVKCFGRSKLFKINIYYNNYYFFSVVMQFKRQVSVSSYLYFVISYKIIHFIISLMPDSWYKAFWWSLYQF